MNRKRREKTHDGEPPSRHQMNTRPTILAAVATHNDDKHTNEGSGSGDRSTVGDRRHNNILSTPHQNSTLILHHLDNVDFSRHYDNVHKLPPPTSGSKLL